jgi:hypothetical protein
MHAPSPHQPLGMSASDFDIHRAARQWIAQHGDQATAKAREPVEQMRAKGDVEGADTWLRIEQVFAKLKILLRKAAKQTTEPIWRQIGTLLATFSPQECASSFRNPGYASK